MINRPTLLSSTLTLFLLGSTAISQAVDLLSPGDTILGGFINIDNFEVGVAGTVGGANNWPGHEGPALAIDGVGQKYLNFAELNTGVVITPSIGSSIATAMKLWTANDAEPRDPASYEIYGTNADLGVGPFPVVNFTLIASGNLALPSSRNGGGVALLDDANSQEVTFPGNANSYTSYMIVFPTVKDVGIANSMQIAEIQLMGITGPLQDTDGDGLTDEYENANNLDPNDNGLNPNNNGVAGDPDQGADGDPDMDNLTNTEERDLGTDPQDEDSDGDGYNDDVEDGGGLWVSASQTGTDPLDPDSDNDTLLDGVENPDLPFDPGDPANQPGTDPNLADTDNDTVKDAAEIAANRDPTVADPLPPTIFNPGDAIFGGQVQGNNFVIGIVGGDGAGNAWPGQESPEHAIDGVGQKYLNFGNLNTGVLVTPSGGPSVADTLVLWAANDAIPRDPASYELYGTNADPLGPGPYPINQFTLISAGALALPDSRNQGGNADLDAINSQTVEIANNSSYTSYLIVFPTITDNGAANSMQIAEIQLVGRFGVPTPRFFDINNAPGDMLEFIFESKPGKVYDIRRSTNPAAETDPKNWTLWQTDIASTPPQTTVTFTRPGDPSSFFFVFERDIPPPFTEDFESGAPGFTTHVNDGLNNTLWAFGTPSAGSGPASGAGGSPTCAITNLGAYGVNSDISLRSPLIDADGLGLIGQDLVLNHEQFRDTDTGETAEWRVLAADLTVLGSVPIDMSLFDFDWESTTVDIPGAWITEDFHLELNFTSDGTNDPFAGLGTDNWVLKFK